MKEHEQALLPSLSDAPKICVPGDGELHRISCPYCKIGYADVLVEKDRRTNSTRVHDIRQLRQCVTCHKFFRLVPRVTIEGSTF